MVTNELTRFYSSWKTEDGNYKEKTGVLKKHFSYDTGVSVAEVGDRLEHEGWAQRGTPWATTLRFQIFFQGQGQGPPSYEAQSGHGSCTNYNRLAPAQSGPSPTSLNVRTGPLEVKRCWTQRGRVFGKE